MTAPTQERCERCDKPRATEADFCTVSIGDNMHLCWSSYGGACEAIDWRARALAAEETARTEAAAHDAWQARAERAEQQVCDAAQILNPHGSGSKDPPICGMARDVVARAQKAEAALRAVEILRVEQQARAEAAEDALAAEREACTDAHRRRFAAEEALAEQRARAERAEAEREQAVAQVVGLVEAATAFVNGWATLRGLHELQDALSSAADLAVRTRAQIRAEALREAADLCAYPKSRPPISDGLDAAVWLRDLAAKEET